MGGTNWKEGKASLSSPKQIMRFTDTLEHALIILKMYGKWACSREFSVSKKLKSNKIGPH